MCCLRHWNFGRRLVANEVLEVVDEPGGILPAGVAGVGHLEPDVEFLAVAEVDGALPGLEALADDAELVQAGARLQAPLAHVGERAGQILQVGVGELVKLEIAAFGTEATETESWL